MGDAAKNISADFRHKHPNIDWKGLAGMRDKLVHHRLGVMSTRASVWAGRAQLNGVFHRPANS